MAATLTTPRLSHVVSVAQFDRDLVDRLLDRAGNFETPPQASLAGRIMATLFFEPSTRTRLSFESAMVRLGGGVIGTEAARQQSSVAKGESLEDTIRTVAGYCDVMVLRHDEIGAAERAAAVSPVPVINAGDGPGEHPTQALLDVYTIRRELGGIEGRHIVFCGDLRFGRTVRSLARLLALYPGVRLSFVAPPVAAIGDDVLGWLALRGVATRVSHDLDEVIADADVLYQTRIQRERFADPQEYAAAQAGVRIDAALMQRLPAAAIVMHPMPRVDEITRDVDADPRAAYFRQAANGVAVRMALLEELLV